jgi:hypothetical protein
VDEDKSIVICTKFQANYKTKKSTSGISIAFPEAT